MKALKLTRLQMVNLLYSLKGIHEENPISLLKYSVNDPTLNVLYHESVPNFIRRYERKKTKKEYGLSTNEIVDLGNLCELTSFKSTAIQNWIKRDIKELIGQPELGKKYSIDQAAILLIVRDLKSVYDFESIRSILTSLFNTLSDRSDDLINPLKFYEAYATILEKINDLNVSSIRYKRIEENIEEEADSVRNTFPVLSDSQWEQVRGTLILVVLAVLSSHIQRRAHLYFQEQFPGKEETQ
ncbi:DUF1836 domain-containing protein [Bacillus lacus]|uniref:DUF1836 domain-containing protein n=1 Tax=Metabacillus lacus TaxID=1983721 RepID=A0A7X2J0W6_9BACI|nr:DUF1836 domain-containing protein [Metabacillus lacus]MRX73286.1 DUF1836 domain-containing protein [Metabacillus lacus]